MGICSYVFVYLGSNISLEKVISRRNIIAGYFLLSSNRHMRALNCIYTTDGTT